MDNKLSRFFLYFMLTLGEGQNKEYWIEYLQTIQNDSTLRAATYTVQSWCQEIGNFRSIESPANTRSGLISCWNLWIQDIRSDYPVLFNFLKNQRFFDSGTTFLKTLNTFATITHRKILRTHQKYNFTTIFTSFENIISTSVCILKNNFPERRAERTWLANTFREEPTVKRITICIISKIDPTSKIFKKVTATSE